MENKENKEFTEKEAEVIELLDENGKKLLFESHLPTIEDDGNKYFVLIPYVKDKSQIDNEESTKVRILQPVEEEGKKTLEPIADDSFLYKKLYNIFKNQQKNKDTDSAYQRKFREEKEFNDEISKLKRSIEHLDNPVATSYNSENVTLDEILLEEFKSYFKDEQNTNRKQILENFLSIFNDDDFSVPLFLYNNDLLQWLKKEYSSKFAVSTRKHSENKNSDRFFALLHMIELSISNEEKRRVIICIDNIDELGFYSHLLLFSAKNNFNLFKYLIIQIVDLFGYDKIRDNSIAIKMFERLGEYFLSIRLYDIALNSYKIAFSLIENEEKQRKNLDIIRGICNSYIFLRDYESIIKFMVDDEKRWKYPELHISWLASGYVNYAQEFTLNSPKRKKYIDEFYEVLRNTKENLFKDLQDKYDLCNTAWYLDSLLYCINENGVIKEIENIYKETKSVTQLRWNSIFWNEKMKKEQIREYYQNYSSIIFSYCAAVLHKIIVGNLDIEIVSDVFSEIDVFMEDYYNFLKANGEINLESKMITAFGVHYRVFKMKKYFSNDNCKINDELYLFIRCLYIVCEKIKSFLAFKRNDNDEKFDDIVYYTTLEALYYMLEDKRNKSEGLPSDLGKFQMYKFPVFNVWHLNDPKEGKILFEQTLNKTVSADSRLKFLEFFEKYLLGKDDNDSLIFDDRTVFVKSFSRGAKDVLPMWSQYGNDSKGCRIKLGIETFQRLGISKEVYKDFPFRANDDYSLYNVIYCDNSGCPIFKEDYIKSYFDMFKKIITKILDFYSKNGIPRNDNDCKECSKEGCNKCLDTTKIIYNILTPFAYLFKSADYDYERELRVILDRNDMATHKEFKEIPEKPFPRICIFMDNRTAIKEIMLAPKLNEDIIGSYIPFIRVQLEKMKSDAKIVKSNIQLK